MPVPSQSPVRYPNGVSTDSPFGPLANLGVPSPLGYHVWEDDFDFLNPQHVGTKTGNGTIALAAGDGGRLLFTTNSSVPLATDIASLQGAIASFARSAAQAGKKMFFLARLQVASALNAAFEVGLIQQTVTPFTVTDGIYFSKATGAANNLAIKSAIGGVITTLAIPPSAYTLANGVDIDLGFYVDRKGNIMAFVGGNLINVAANNSPAGQVKGPVASLAPAITTAALTPTCALQSGAAASTTLNLDFLMAAKER